MKRISAGPKSAIRSNVRSDVLSFLGALAEVCDEVADISRTCTRALNTVEKVLTVVKVKEREDR